MEERIDEGKIKGAIDAITLEKTEKILMQMKTCICMIYDDLIGTGFFCKIPYSNKKIPVLITNYHIISDDFIKNHKQLKISINNEQIYDIISLNENSKIYSSIKDKYDITIIKLEEEKNIYHYLDLDDHLFDDNLEKIYEDKSIYILHYLNGDKISVSYGYGIQKFYEYYIKHLCNTEHCSSGSPILNLKTNKVIGIHSGAINKNNETKFNIGILLKYPLNELTKENKNEKESIEKNELLNINKINDKKDNENLNMDEFIIKTKLLNDLYIKTPIFSENKNFKENIENCEFNFTESYWKDKCEKIKNLLNADNLKCLDNIPYEYQKFIKVIFSFNNDSFNINEEKKFEDFKNNILFNIDLKVNKNEPKDINLIEITKISEGKKNKNNLS